jgi:hypothetical protein
MRKTKIEVQALALVIGTLCVTSWAYAQIVNKTPAMPKVPSTSGAASASSATPDFDIGRDCRDCAPGVVAPPPPFPSSPNTAPVLLDRDIGIDKSRTWKDMSRDLKNMRDLKAD